MQVTDETKSKMDTAINHFKQELSNIRTGRANPGILETVKVDVYGSQMRLKDIATLAAPEARTITVTPFDNSSLDAIRKGIEEANLGFNPVADGHLIRINIPPMDENARQEMAKLIKKRCEEAKVSIRQARGDGMKSLKKLKGDSEITEDEQKREEKNIQKNTDDSCKLADDLAIEKEKEVMTV